MNEVLARLERIYLQQLEVYDQVLDLADKALQLAREARPLGELDAILAQKRQLLSEIDRLDELAAPDRDWSRDHDRSALESSQLRQTLGKISRRIEEILGREREMERWVLLRRENHRDLLTSSETGD